MKRKIITTKDGSKTIQIEEWNEQYHSIHGAIQEARHVFIKHGLLFFYNSEWLKKVAVMSSGLTSAMDYGVGRVETSLSILEIGFGTGLNAFLTLIEAEKLGITINYTGVEAYPVPQEEIEQLNYVHLISELHAKSFKNMHLTSWEESTKIIDGFNLKKEQKLFKDITASNEFDIVYFDAFGARVQPELWTEDIFAIMYSAMKPKGVLVTYSAKGSVRRAMHAVGFKVERLLGPPGKRHMLRAIKL